jgi:hypothetical protein
VAADDSQVVQPRNVNLVNRVDDRRDVRLRDGRSRGIDNPSHQDRRAIFETGSQNIAGLLSADFTSGDQYGIHQFSLAGVWKSGNRRKRQPRLKT